MRAPRAIRATAWTVVAAGVTAPLVRRRLGLRPSAVLGPAVAAPVALAVVARRSRKRDVALCALQMWAYLAAYEMPYDDPEALEARVRVDYPLRVDRVLGCGVPPTVRLQRLFARPGSIAPLERVFVWCHWVWFAVPHTSLAYVWVRAPARSPRAAALTYAVFDVGVVAYWIVPTAPPWYAAAHGRMEAEAPAGAPTVRRMMIEYGEQFWRDRWPRLYDSLAGNLLAAMPSLHFATSLMAAHLLAEVGPVAGAVGWTYALTLGVALVYLGEHYLVDLLAGLALTETIRGLAPRLEPAFARTSRRVGALEALAHG